MYPRIGIRPVIDGRQFGVREDLEEQTMNMAYAAKNLSRRHQGRVCHRSHHHRRRRRGI